MFQLLCLSDSHPWTVKWLFHQLPSPRRCDAIPACHFQSSFGVLALCSMTDSGTASALLFVRPTNVVQSFLHPSSFHDQPVHVSFVFLRSTAWIGSNHTLFLQLLMLVLCRPLFSNEPSWLVSKASSSRPAGRSLSCRHCGHLTPKSRVSHKTAPASPLPCSQVCTSEIYFLHA